MRFTFALATAALVLSASTARAVPLTIEYSLAGGSFSGPFSTGPVTSGTLILRYPNAISVVSAPLGPVTILNLTLSGPSGMARFLSPVQLTSSAGYVSFFRDYVFLLNGGIPANGTTGGYSITGVPVQGFFWQATGMGGQRFQGAGSVFATNPFPTISITHSFLFGQEISRSTATPTPTPSPTPCALDTDLDGVSDCDDNCLLEPNPLQVDPDQDGFGVVCDADINQDGIVGVDDVFAHAGMFGSGAPPADEDLDHLPPEGNGVVGVDDVFFAAGAFGAAPGPSGLACADCSSGVCNTPCP